MLEAEIKFALINRLHSSGKVGDGDVVASELKVAGGARRADLVLANGKLQAFEVKSDSDTLERLEAQVGVYLEHFDKVTVVSGEKHLDRILDVVPDRVEVLQITKANAGYCWKVARRGRTENIVDAAKLLAFVPVKLAVKRLREAGVACPTNIPRSEVEKIARHASIAKLREIVISYIKERHLDANRKFSQSRLKSIEKRISLLSVTSKPPRTDFLDVSVDEKTILSENSEYVKDLPGAVRVRSADSCAPLYVLRRATYEAQSSSSS